MWRDPVLTDRFFSDDVTHVADGREWFYAYEESTRRLHRLRYNEPVHQVAIPRRQPSTYQELTQVFYNKKNSRHSNWVPPYRPPGVRRWGGRRRPELAIAVVNPNSLDLHSLTAVYGRLSPSPKTTPFSMRQTALRRVVPLLEESGWCLVTHVPDGVKSMTITPYLHLIPTQSLPVTAKPHQRAPRINPAMKITVLRDNPKTKGSKAWARFEQYRNGMTAAQYIALVGRVVGRADLTNDHERGYISLSLL